MVANSFTRGPWRLLKVSSAAGRLDCSASQVRKLMRAGALKEVRLPGATGNREMVRVCEKSLVAFMDRPRQEVAGSVRRSVGRSYF